MAGQPARAAKRFMLVAAALELATEWGITGFAQGTGAAGVLACFNAWLEREGSGNRVLAKGGRLDPTYKITVPRSLDAGQ